MSKKTRRAKARRALLTLSLVLVMMMAAVGGTIAWLTDKTDSVVNTFTPSNIDITLTETKDGNTATDIKDFPMVPGATIEKDPLVTVKANSEAAYVFVKVEKTQNFGTYLEYTIAEGWTELTEGSGIYWRIVAKSDKDQSFAVIADNQVNVKQDVTNAQMAAAATNAPKLTFTAYAVQQSNGNGTFTAAQAWEKAVADANVKYGN